jgi:hypothetical protein
MASWASVTDQSNTDCSSHRSSAASDSDASFLTEADTICFPLLEKLAFIINSSITSKDIKKEINIFYIFLYLSGLL